MQVNSSSNSKNCNKYHSPTTPEMFIVKALEKILSDRETKKSHNSQIKKACKTALGELKVLVY